MQLLQHFKDLTLHPKNAKEIKGLILQLAIQGKLTANWRKDNPDVEPASELLKRIEKEKAQLIKEKKNKKEKSLPKITKDEIPFTISKKWLWTRLEDLGTTNIGLTYNPSQINQIGTPVLRSSNVQDGELCLKDLVRVNAPYREKDLIKEGDLLICVRNGSRRLVGKCTIINQINEVMVFGAFMAIFRSRCNPYLQLFIQSPQFRSKLDGVETTTINQITQGNLKSTLVPLPPLEEQQEIVRVVEILFKEVEQLEQLTKERIALKEDFVTSALRQLTTANTATEWQYLQNHFKSFFTEKSAVKKVREAVLQLAVQGKLTVDWRKNNPETEPATELLKRIQKEKAQLIKNKKIKKESPLPPISDDEVPYELPESWVWCRFQEIIKISSGMGLTSANMDKTGEIPVYGGNGITGYHSKGNVAKPTIVIGRVGYYCGSIHLTETIAWITDNAFITNFSEENIYRDFLLWLLQATDLKKDENATAQPVISGRKVYPLIVALPPLEEQKAIVEKVNTLMLLCDQLEQVIEESKNLNEQLMKSVLREVFEGDLID